MDALYTFWDNITHYKTECVHFLGLMNSATKLIQHLFPTSALKLVLARRTIEVYIGFGV